MVDEWLVFRSFSRGFVVHGLFLDLGDIGNKNTWLGLGNKTTWLGFFFAHLYTYKPTWLGLG